MPEVEMTDARLAEPMRKPLTEFATTIRSYDPSNVKALTLYGAALSDSFNPERDTARSVLVVDHVDLEMLRRLSRQGLRLGKAHIAAPLIMTPTYIDQSRDTFPLELIEIQQQHHTLFGEDFFENLEFEDRHVRLQCERELKVILIGLRQGLLASAGRDKLLGALVMDVAAALVRTLRGMLWLKKKRENRKPLDIVAEVETVTERKLAGVRTALDSSAEHGWPEFQKLYDDVEVLGEAVNGW